VHLEDNEMAVRSVISTAWDPEAIQAFLDDAVGVTVVVDRLLELKPAHVPGVVVWPGYDEAIDRPGRPRPKVRRDIGLGDRDIAIAYTGSVHPVNADEVRALYEAVSDLQARGHELVLVKTGFNTVPASDLPTLGRGIRDLGWIQRRRILEVLSAADILVQPGSPGPFNDYRFPSKVPDFLAAGRPVVLPRTNIGLNLRNRVDALLLERGDADEISLQVELLITDPSLREQLAEQGRAFAVRELRWSKTGERLADFYGIVLEGDAAEGAADRG
jgi:glycosyltransferase involved in cell wall biosynthesis